MRPATERAGTAWGPAPKLLLRSWPPPPPPPVIRKPRDGGGGHVKLRASFAHGRQVEAPHGQTNCTPFQYFSYIYRGRWQQHKRISVTRLMRTNIIYTRSPLGACAVVIDIKVIVSSGRILFTFCHEDVLVHIKNSKHPCKSPPTLMYLNEILEPEAFCAEGIVDLFTLSHSMYKYYFE